MLRVSERGHWVVYEAENGRRLIQFDSRFAHNAAPKPLAPSMPDRIPTSRTAAMVDANGNVLVIEGMHRLEAAQGGALIPAANGGISGAPGWLQYDFRSSPALNF